MTSEMLPFVLVTVALAATAVRYELRIFRLTSEVADLKMQLGGQTQRLRQAEKELNKAA